MNGSSNNWTPGEAAAINEFLNTKLGTKWLTVLYSLKPPLDTSSMEKAALSGATGSGYDLVFRNISLSRQTRTTEEPSIAGIDPTKD